MNVIKRDGTRAELDVTKLRKAIRFACESFPSCNADELEVDAHIQFREDMTTKEIQRTLIRAAVEKTSVEKPDWQYVAARLLTYDLYKDAANNRGYDHFGYGNFYELILALTLKGHYGKYLLDNYTEAEIKELASYISPERDELFNYSGLRLLSDRYIVRDYGKKVMELPQERFMIIAMHLAMLEEKKVYWARKFYAILSKLQMTVATPTMTNAGRPHHQLSSCFIDTVGDSLDAIMATAHNAARVSKYGGGVGIYIGKVRSRGAAIRGHKGASGGIVPWARIYNQIAISVDQLGQRAGAFAIYLDVWHADIMDFLEGKTNNGDDRMKFHDVFPGVCMPDIFYRIVKERGTWYLFDPHEVETVMGFRLEDSFDDAVGGEFTRRYQACVDNLDLSRIEVPAIDIMKKIMKSASETGTPFIFNRDTVNRANPNKHAGMIFSSNLCTEIMQNMSAAELVSETLTDENGETFIVTKTKPGDFVTCNLSSLNIGRFDKKEDVSDTVMTQMRMMDNVIDLNYYPVEHSKYTNRKYRAVGLGTSGYHQHLAQHAINWESDQHIEYADAFYEEIAYWGIKGSMVLAKEKGAYPLFKGSEWETGEYFTRRGYITIDHEGTYFPVEGKERWYYLALDVRAHGMRNAWVFAIAPTGATSLIAGSTASIDPIFSKFFIEEKKDGLVPQAAPNLNQQTFWYYKEAHNIDQLWSIRAAGARQHHIDQGQSFNLYITPAITGKEFLNLYLAAWEAGVKTIYYVRNKSLEVDDCISCSA
jgi:ribonucleoside-diphosphate reductase alpha chain